MWTDGTISVCIRNQSLGCWTSWLHFILHACHDLHDGIDFSVELTSDHARRAEYDRIRAEMAGPQDVRLPGDVGAVRDLEVPHPSFELPKAGDDFTLSGGNVEDGRKQGNLF